MFRIDFSPYMSLASRQAHGAQIFAAFRLLEFVVYSGQGQPCEFILADAVSAHETARELLPPRVLS